MTRTRWLISVLSWDSALPLVVCLSPVWLRACAANCDLAELFSFLLVPMVAALIRAGAGARQLNDFGLYASWWRQLLFGIAIIVMLLFECLSAMLQLAPGDNELGWVAILVFYVLYLALVLLALCPPGGSWATSFSEKGDFL